MTSYLDRFNVFNALVQCSFFSEWYNKQCIHKNWQSYTQINRRTICAIELPFRVQLFRGVNCGLIPYGRGYHLGHATPIPKTMFSFPGSMDVPLVIGL